MKFQLLGGQIDGQVIQESQRWERFVDQNSSALTASTLDRVFGFFDSRVTEVLCSLVIRSTGSLKEWNIISYGMKEVF